MLLKEEYNRLLKSCTIANMLCNPPLLHSFLKKTKKKRKWDNVEIFFPNKIGIAWFSQMKTRWFHKKIKGLFVAHRLFQINVFRTLYSFEFCHCVNTTDHVGWIILSRVMLKFCQNCLYVLMKLTRFGSCLFIQSLFIKVQSINDSCDTGCASGDNNFPSEIIYLHLWSAVISLL